MKLGIYQSYIKEPQKFFAPSSPCRANLYLNPVKPQRKMIQSENPIVLQILPLSTSSNSESDANKFKEQKKSSSVHMAKVELILEDIFHQQRPKSDKLKTNLQIFRRPNTSKTFYGNTAFRPFTINSKYIKKHFKDDL